MGKQSLWSRVKELIGGVAFDVFCWSIGMTQEQYITAISQEAIRGYLDAESDYLAPQESKLDALTSDRSIDA